MSAVVPLVGGCHYPCFHRWGDLGSKESGTSSVISQLVAEPGFEPRSDWLSMIFPWYHLIIREGTLGLRSLLLWFLRFVENWWALGGKVGGLPALMWSVEYSPMICDFLHGLAIEDFDSFFQIPSLYSTWASKMWALWGRGLISVATSVRRTTFHTVGFSKYLLKKYQI